jgi:hypothetical protein
LEAVKQLEQGTDEALAQLAIDQPEPAVMDWHGEQPPFQATAEAEKRDR